MSKLSIVGLVILGISGCAFLSTYILMMNCSINNFGDSNAFFECFKYSQPIIISQGGIALGVLLLIVGIVQSFLKKKSETNIQYGDRFNMSGTFNGSVVNIRSQISEALQQIETTHAANAQTRVQLKDLLIALGNELQQAPATKAAEAEAVAQMARQLVDEATKDKPNKPLLQISAQGLRQAAENIASVLPKVLSISTKIIDVILGPVT